MSKMKKLFAMMMAMVMILAMGMTTFAAGEKATITISNADKAEKVEMVQIIQANPATDTGWEFINGAGAQYQVAFGQSDEQIILASLIKYVDDSATFTVEKLNAAQAATAAQIDKALSNVAANCTFSTLTTKTPEVESAGVYAIKAEETGYTYKTMSAYVGFGVAPALVNTTVTAKKSPTIVTKTDTDTDKVVAIGDTVTFNVTTNFPYIDPNATEKSFVLTDTITGAAYQIGTTTEIKIGDTIVPTNKIVVTEDGKSFTLDLSEYITADNANAGKAVTIKYDAIVTDPDINNAVSSNLSGKPVVDYLYTGQITLTKYAENGTTTLAGAEFEVTKEGSTDVLKFTATTEKGVYTYDPNGAVTNVAVNDNGVLVVKGLDAGKYHFKETKAPTGYSINANGADAELKLEAGKTTAEATIKATTNLNDTKLSALPATGGIGTTIFTVGGCAIMIVAAALFFASRKKNNK